jgi:hypothetical protein
MTVTCSLFIDVSLFSPSGWRFETKTEIIGKRRPAIQTCRIAALARLINIKVLTMSWLIFPALLLPASQDPQFPPIGIKALPSLIEMARWKSSGHAQASFVLLGRVAGLPENEINAAWGRGERASFIETAIKRAKAK